ncbi:MAG TPA: superoxide dismutase [Verrucomicrobiales bacterium]|nr:superoxide dismutase [Verrucomicrobiales bacterium]
MSYTLPDLPYAPDALEPHIDARTMEIHHGKHHQTYITNLNKALEGQSGLAGLEIEELVSHLENAPESIRTTVRNNGGGHLNHSLFWTWMSPDGGGEPEGDLAGGLRAAFGGFDGFREAFTQAALTRFGSGWAWLVVKADGALGVTSTPNQDNPLMGAIAGCDGSRPILGLDVWEHAYYLHYQNRRPDYVGAFWNVVDWKKVGENYAAARA